MPQATLTFTLPDERDEHETAVHAGALRSVIEAHREWLRSQLKYHELSEPARAKLDEARAALWTEIEDAGVAGLFS